MLLKAPLNKENNVEVRCNLLILDQILVFVLGLVLQPAES